VWPLEVFLMVTANQATFPGFPFPNTTQIPNDVIDSLMPQLSGGELKVLLYICRRTFGFQKDSDRISLSQIAHGITTKTGKVLDHGTGLCKRHVITALKTLEKKNIISITRTVDETGLNSVNTYRLNMASAGHTAEPPAHQGVVNSTAPLVVHSSSPGVVNERAPTKQRKQKKEEQNKADDDGVAQALKNFGMTPAAIPALLERYPVAYIREKLRMTHGLLTEGSALVAKNPVGWLRRAIEENYQPPRHKGRMPSTPGRNRQQPAGIPDEEPGAQGFVLTSPVVRPQPRQTQPQPDRQTQSIWKQAVELLQHDLPASETAHRLTGTQLIEMTETKAVILVPNSTIAALLERRFYLQIAKALKEIVGKDLDLQFVYAV
jgi:phage replication O-like protein O